MNKLIELDKEINPLIDSLKTISDIMDILGTLNTGLFSADNLKSLKRGDRKMTLNLIEKGVPSKYIRQAVFGLGQLSTTQVDQIAILLGRMSSYKEIDKIIILLENIKVDKNKIQLFMEGGSYDKAFSLSVTIRERLRELRAIYNLDTERAEKVALDIQKVCGYK